MQIRQILLALALCSVTAGTLPHSQARFRLHRPELSQPSLSEKEREPGPHSV